jgi:hypothetical protein
MEAIGSLLLMICVIVLVFSLIAWILRGILILYAWAATYDFLGVMLLVIVSATAFPAVIVVAIFLGFSYREES